MLIDNENLWPDDLVVPVIDTFMVAILRQQAKLLSRMTRNILRGEVETSGSPTSDALNHSFYIKAMMLPGGYRYKLFHVTQGGLSAYPVEIHTDDCLQVTTEQEFRKAVGDILCSAETRIVIRSLLDASQ